MTETISWLRVPEENDLPDEVKTLFAKAEKALGEVPHVFRVFALHPRLFMKWFTYYDDLMRNEQSELTHIEREMLALVVSTENRCEYCLGSHGAYLRALTDDHVKTEVITHNYRRADLSPRERAILDFAHKMTHVSHEMTQDDLQPLRDMGLSDVAIFEVAQVVGMFNFTNRIANALGWRPNESYYTQHRP